MPRSSSARSRGSYHLPRRAPCALPPRGHGLRPEPHQPGPVPPPPGNSGGHGDHRDGIGSDRCFRILRDPDESGPHQREPCGGRWLPGSALLGGANRRWPASSPSRRVGRIHGRLGTREVGDRSPVRRQPAPRGPTAIAGRRSRVSNPSTLPRGLAVPSREGAPLPTLPSTRRRLSVRLPSHG